MAFKNFQSFKSGTARDTKHSSFYQEKCVIPAFAANGKAPIINLIKAGPGFRRLNRFTIRQ